MRTEVTNTLVCQARISPARHISAVLSAMWHDSLLFGMQPALMRAFIANAAAFALYEASRAALD